MNNNIDNGGLSRDQEIAAVISARYSVDDQIALLRQKDGKPEEWEEFYSFCESVKAKIPRRDEGEENE